MKLTENILNPAGKTLKAYIPPTVEFDELEEEQFMAGSPVTEESDDLDTDEDSDKGPTRPGGSGRSAKAASFIFEDPADMEMPEADFGF